MARLLFLQEVAFEYVGVMCLSAYAKSRGHQCDILIASEEKRHFWDKVIEYKPDVVGFSAMTGFHIPYLKMADKVKEILGVPTIFGGPHPTFFPEMIEHPAVDIICRGEGEEAIIELLDAIDRDEDYERIDNLWVKSNSGIVRNEVRCIVKNLDDYPRPDREIYYKYKYLRD